MDRGSLGRDITAPQRTTSPLSIASLNPYEKNQTVSFGSYEWLAGFAANVQGAA